VIIALLQWDSQVGKGLQSKQRLMIIFSNTIMRSLITWGKENFNTLSQLM